MTAGGLLLAAGWMLVGTLVTDARSVAIVESGSGAQQVLREGGAFEDCMVDTITRDELLLNCAAGAQRLPLQSSSRPSSIEIVAARPHANPFSLPDESFRALLTDRQRVASQISLEPAVAGGLIYGYRVVSLEGGNLTDIGIAAGDVITNVNGAAAGDGDVFMQTVDALAGQKSFSIEIDRRGRQHQLVYVLE